MIPMQKFTLLRQAYVKSFLVSLVALFLFSCSNKEPDSPEAMVRKTIQNLEEAAEARSLKDFMQHVSPDYRDHRGETWKDVQRLIQLQYIRNQSIHIFSDITAITVEGNTATAEINVAMAARASDLESETLRLRADTHRFSVLFTRSEPSDQWLVSSVAWQRGW